MRIIPLLSAVALAAGLAGCEREHRDFRDSPPGSAPDDPVVTMMREGGTSTP